MKKSLITSLILLFLVTNIFGQFTRENAIDLVLNSILVNEVGEIDIYSSFDELQYGDTVFLASYASYQICPYNGNWVFFSDDMPVAGWHHPSRYIFVNSENGEYLIVEDDIYPKYIMTDFEPISFVEITTQSPPDYTGQPFTTTPSPNDHLYALLITATDLKEQWKDISAVYNTLINVYGYKKENIYVFYAEGYSVLSFGEDFDGDLIHDDIDFPASYNDIHETFQYMSGELTGNSEIPELQPGDQLFILTDGHGDGSSGNSFVYLNDGILNDTELASWVSEIKCSQMIFHIQQCRSGGFIDDLSNLTNVECTNREVHAACEPDENSVSEVWVTYDGQGQPGLYNVNFTEYLFYWNAAARGYFPDFDQPWLNITEYTVGEFPLENYVPGHPGNWNPDTNNDGIVTMGEAHEYAHWMDTWSYHGVFIPFWENLPSHYYHSPDPFYEIQFFEDILTLFGLTGEIINTQSIHGNFLVGGDLYIKPGVNLTIEEGTGIYLGNEMANITVESGASLIIEDNVDFHGFYENQINVDGSIQTGTVVNFTAEEDAQLQLQINNTNIDLTMDNVHFNNAAIIAYNNTLTITNSDFTNGGIWGFNGNFDISNTEFFSSFVNISNADGNERYVYITDNCNFSGFQLTSAIDIDNYPNFKINNCNIGHCASAISLFNCGHGKKYHQITGNRIVDNSGTGISVYHTSAYIKHNEIENNSYGIKSYNKSKVHLEGDQLVVSQKIKDNDSYEIYASEGSFPYYFHWNLVQDDDNLPSDPLVKYSGSSGGIELLDVENNCWGYEFVANEDLEPLGGYDWQPEWECMNGSGTSTSSDAENMFFGAKAEIEDEDFAGAKTEFQQIVVQYPTSKYAQASLKELYSLEAFVTNDYSDLKSYYASEPNIVADSELAKLADFLINFCEIKLENWPTAIAWFENVIQNPKTMEDSIFAIIDLGYTYFLMENSGQKAAYAGNLTEHIPVSNEQFEEKRDFLLSLLPGDQLSETMKENINSLKTGELLQNVPNPFSGTTQIWFKLEQESSVVINVFDYTGKQIKSFNTETKNKGSHFIEFDGSGLPNGIYFYSIIINGKKTDSKKMTLIK